MKIEVTDRPSAKALNIVGDNLAAFNADDGTRPVKAASR